MLNRQLWGSAGELKMKIRFGCRALALVFGGTTVSVLAGCNSGGSASLSDAGTDSSADSSSTVDASSADASTDSSATDATSSSQALQILTTTDAGLKGGPGEALGLQVVFLLADGGTVPVPSNLITWTIPETVVAQNPNSPGPNSILPEAGAQPTAFFILNNYRENHFGALFIVDPGTTADAGLQVTASVSDAGEVSAWVSVTPAPDGAT